MDTPARLLRLLAMFTTRPSWNADELAGRLEITDRTLRRDIARLRDLGYPIVSTTGRYGGYELGAGGRLPPLLLDDDEATAVAVALRDLSRDADPTLGEAALSALTKLRQVLPEPLRDRVDALGEVTVGFENRPAPSGDGAAIELPSLMTFAMACRRRERVTFTYRDGADRVTERRVEPHRLVSLGRRWYLVGFDLDRDDWRTYRVDRTSALATTGHRNTPRETPDAAAQVSEGVALRVFDIQAVVRVYAPRAEVAMRIGPSIGVFEPGEPSDPECIVRIGGDPDWTARFLVGLPFRFEVLEPDSVRDEICVLARRMLSEHTR
ncbi:helix-turn-helix transcriptional regulator [Desertimonas flava]|uniref:helix-turn-helix transcriptional regulator n=1 Tax=Desertimonas flava TaxID=2064846 RepID=UPI0013C3F153|nr:YafY family protein [Desertimonas flava]